MGKRKMEMTFGKVKWKSVNKFAHTIQDKCSLSLSRLNEFLLNYNIFDSMAWHGIAFRSLQFRFCSNCVLWMLSSERYGLVCSHAIVHCRCIMCTNIERFVHRTDIPYIHQANKSEWIKWTNASISLYCTYIHTCTRRARAGARHISHLQTSS